MVKSRGRGRGRPPPRKPNGLSQGARPAACLYEPEPQRNKRKFEACEEEGGQPAVSPQEVEACIEAYVETNQLDERIAELLRGSPPEVARKVISRGNIRPGARNPSAIVNSWIKDAKIECAIEDSCKARAISQGGVHQGRGRQLMQRRDDSQTAEGRDVSWTSQGRDLSRTPSRHEASQTPQRENMSSVAPSRHETAQAPQRLDMSSVEPQTPPDNQRKATLARRYRVDNSSARRETDGTMGLAYRLSPNMDDKDGLECAAWGSVVWGSAAQEDGFVKVGQRYLPSHLQGKPVLVRLATAAKRSEKKEEPQTGMQGTPGTAAQEVLQETDDGHTLKPKSKMKAKAKFKARLRPTKVPTPSRPVASQISSESNWTCECGFVNKARNTLCGGNGPMGCKKFRSDMIEEQDRADSLDPLPRVDKMSLVNDVKAWQRKSLGHKESWYRYVGQLGSGQKDPNRHDVAVLADFIAKAEAGMIEVAVGIESTQPEAQVTEMSRSSGLSKALRASPADQGDSRSSSDQQAAGGTYVNPFRSMEPCRDWAIGRCNRGEACRFSHDADSSAAIRKSAADMFQGPTLLLHCADSGAAMRKPESAADMLKGPTLLLPSADSGAAMRKPESAADMLKGPTLLLQDADSSAAMRKPESAADMLKGPTLLFTPNMIEETTASDGLHVADTSASDEFRSEEPCRAWTIGRCIMGNACRYSHGTEATASNPMESEDQGNSTGSNERQASGGRPPCRYWVLGRCNRGEACRYSHGSGATASNIVWSSDQSDDMQIDDQASNPMESEDQGNSTSSNERQASGGRPPCRYWLVGRCNRGEACRYSHGSGATASNTVWSNDQSDDMQIDDQADHKQKVLDSRPLCKFWLKGRCNRGEQCRFSHDDGYAASASANSEEKNEGHGIRNSSQEESEFQAADVSSSADSSGFGHTTTDKEEESELQAPDVSSSADSSGFGDANADEEADDSKDAMVGAATSKAAPPVKPEIADSKWAAERSRPQAPKAPKVTAPFPASSVPPSMTRRSTQTKAEAAAPASEPSAPPATESSTAPAASESSSGEGSGGVGLSWRGRWGCWESGSNTEGVHLLATCVGVFDVALSQAAAAESHSRGSAEILEAALQAVRSALASELPPGAVLAAVHWTPTAAGSRYRSLRAAVVGDTIACEQLQPHWQHRAFCDGAAVVTWTFCFDSASAQHCQRVAGMFQQDDAAHTGFRLHLPATWVMKESKQGCTSLSPGDHWFDFAALFGLVTSAEFVGLSSAGADGVHLLVDFASTDGARCMYEALTDRYLYNPQRRHKPDECHPVSCEIGGLEKMRETLKRQQLAAPHTPSKDGSPVVFELHRRSRNGAAVLPAGCLLAPPELVALSSLQKQYVVGREEACAVMLRHPHISKMHATLTLREAQDSPAGKAGVTTWSLMIQDTSSNGTWVNGQLLIPRQPTELKDTDIISFLLPGPALDDDDTLTYKVVAKPLPQPAATPQKVVAKPMPQPIVTPNSQALSRQSTKMLPMAPPAPPKVPARLAPPVPPPPPPRPTRSLAIAKRRAPATSHSVEKSPDAAEQAMDTDDVYTLPAPTQMAAPATRRPPRNRSRSRDGRSSSYQQGRPKPAAQAHAKAESRTPVTNNKLPRSAMGSTAARADPLGILDDPRWSLNSHPPLDWEQNQGNSGEVLPQGHEDTSIEEIRAQHVLGESTAAAAGNKPPRIQKTFAQAEQTMAQAETLAQFEDIGSWLRCIGGEQFVAQYEAELDGQYENVAQIRALYKDSIHAFFEDCAVQDQEHQRLFEAAIVSNSRPSAPERPTHPGAWGPPASLRASAPVRHSGEWTQNLWDEL